MINTSNLEYGGIPEPEGAGFNPLNVLHGVQRHLQHRRAGRVIEKMPHNFKKANNTRKVTIDNGSLGMGVTVAWEESYTVEAHTVKIGIGGNEYNGAVNSVMAEKSILKDGKPVVVATFSSFAWSDAPNTLPFSEVMRNLNAALHFVEDYKLTSAVIVAQQPQQ